MSELAPALGPVLLPGDAAQRAAAVRAALEARARDPAACEKAARDFESILVHRLLEEMRRTIPDSGLLSDGTSDQVEGLFWFHLAEEVGRQGGLGLWKELARQMAGATQAPPPDPVVESTA